MNFIAIIILLTIIIDFIVNWAADILNLRYLRDDVPEVFQDVYDAERYQKSQEYLKVNTRFGWITATFDLIVMLIFWFGKGFPLLDHWVRSWDHGPVISGLMYMGILLLFKAVLSLPFSIYDTFVIEERFGFNKTTWQTYIADLIKGLVLSILLGGALLGGDTRFSGIRRPERLAVLLGDCYRLYAGDAVHCSHLDHAPV